MKSWWAPCRAPSSAWPFPSPPGTASSGWKATTPHLTAAATGTPACWPRATPSISSCKDAFPINVLNAIKLCPEVCRIFCATANPVEVILAQTEQGRGILGVVDGDSPKGVEDDAGRAWRHEILRKFGYKK